METKFSNTLAYEGHFKFKTRYLLTWSVTKDFQMRIKKMKM